MNINIEPQEEVEVGDHATENNIPEPPNIMNKPIFLEPQIPKKYFILCGIFVGLIFVGFIMWLVVIKIFRSSLPNNDDMFGLVKESVNHILNKTAQVKSIKNIPLLGENIHMAAQVEQTTEETKLDIIYDMNGYQIQMITTISVSETQFTNTNIEGTYNFHITHNSMEFTSPTTKTNSGKSTNISKVVIVCYMNSKQPTWEKNMAYTPDEQTESNVKDVLNQIQDIIINTVSEQLPLNTIHYIFIILNLFFTLGGLIMFVITIYKFKGRKYTIMNKCFMGLLGALVLISLLFILIFYCGFLRIKPEEENDT